MILLGVVRTESTRKKGRAQDCYQTSALAEHEAVSSQSQHAPNIEDQPAINSASGVQAAEPYGPSNDRRIQAGRLRANQDEKENKAKLEENLGTAQERAAID